MMPCVICGNSDCPGAPHFKGICPQKPKKITRNELYDRFGEVIPAEVVNFLFGEEAKGMTVAQARAEIDKRWPKRDKADGPKEADNPDWAAVLKLARDTLAERKGPNYTDDSDMPQYIYEAVMEAVFPGYFAWCRTL